ncbi:hypothetical protein Tco_1017743 [Tanacetum coccineum]|uniref:Reverse transcriptase domain-containing protein n=1 Tax=Tanacetum coccineum TaxID=301880 RepID=A0ABQ5FTR9_9ASTR
MSMTIHSCVKDKILEAQGEASKDFNAPAKMLRGLYKQFERKDDGGLYFVDRIWVSLSSNMRTLIMDEAHTTKYLVHPGADKIFTKYAHFLAIREDYKMEKLARLYINGIIARHSVLRKPLKFSIADKLTDCDYKELSGIHDTFHVSNQKKCLADANLHVPLDEIKIDNSLRFVEEQFEIMDHEVKKLKQIRIPIVKVRWNSWRGFEYTWSREDEMKRKYSQLFMSATS